MFSDCNLLKNIPNNISKFNTINVPTSIIL